MIVCIDTNAVLGMFGRGAPLLVLRQALLAGRFTWALSTEILLEYEEVATREMGAAGAARMVRFIELVAQTRGAIQHVSPTFRFRAIPSDPDDDKFADCGITAGAEFVITEDRHFHALNDAGYKPKPITPEEFIRRHLGIA